MNDEKREGFVKVFDIIETLTDDCESQYNSLKENQDVKWDVYDHDNWDNMVDNLNKMKGIIFSELEFLTTQIARSNACLNASNEVLTKLNRETHVNKTKVTRESGKEL